MTTKSAQDVLQEYVNIYGSADGPVVARLTNDVSNLFQEWRTFLYFFCGPSERLEVLNQASGRTSRLFRRLLWDSALLRIRRLIDPEIDRKNNKNLSLHSLVRIAKKPPFEHILKTDFNELEAKCKPAKKFVDKYLAHFSKGHALGSKPALIQRQQTTDAVRAIGAFVNKFHAATRDTDFRFSPFTAHKGESDFLLMLYRGVELTKARDAQHHEDPLPLPEWIFVPTGDFEYPT